MTRLDLYGTFGCHLCEEAERMLLAAKASDPFLNWRTIDIAGDEDLLREYGERIPVLRWDAGGRELSWPFRELELHRFLAALEDGSSFANSEHPTSEALS